MHIDEKAFKEAKKELLNVYDIQEHEYTDTELNFFLQTYLQATKTKPEPVFMTGKTYEPWGK